MAVLTRQKGLQLTEVQRVPLIIQNREFFRASWRFAE